MQRLLLTLLTVALFLNGSQDADAAKPFWQKVVPRKNVASDPSGDYTLTKEHGPWLIMAMYFSGEEGEQQARDLVLDLRKNHGLEAYHWGMSFKLDDANPGRGMDNYGGKIRRRYRRGGQSTEHAVLVGHFPAVGDPEAQDVLARVKSLTPQSLSSEQEDTTAESLTNVHKFRNYLRTRNGKGDKKGPMGQAFISRNPLLPKEYFVPKGVEPEVAKWNTGPEYSLLNCPGRYTIKVATFKGRTSLKQDKVALQDKRTRKAKEDDPLVLAVKNAHLLTVALREKGWDAYEFHDRTESYVTVGSFDDGQQTPDGRVVLNDRDAKIITDTFGASTPNNHFNRPAQQDLQLEQQRRRQFDTLFANKGQVANGFYPKKFVGLPFDIYPVAITVPRESISSAYVRN